MCRALRSRGAKHYGRTGRLSSAELTAPAVLVALKHILGRIVLLSDRKESNAVITAQTCPASSQHQPGYDPDA